MRIEDRFFIDEFGRLWRGRAIDDEEMSMFWIFKGISDSSSPVELWVIQGARGEFLENYEHDEIDADQLVKAISLFRSTDSMTG